MAAEWVPFHRSLTRGTKRGLPRGVRFVYLEVALEARHGDGRIRMPAGFPSDADALHDMLGGDKRELVAALKTLTAPLPGEDEPMLRFDGDAGCRSLAVVAFHDWAKPAETSTPRVQKHRAAKAAARAATAHKEQPDETPGNVSGETIETPQIRSQETRSEETPKPPEGAETGSGSSNPLPKSEVRLWGETWIGQYETGMRRGLGRPFAFERKHLNYLEQCVETFCIDRSRIFEWVDKAAYEFGRAQRSAENPAMWSSYQAKGLLRWFNEDRPGYNGTRPKAPGSAPGTPALAPPPVLSAEEQAQSAQAAKEFRDAIAGIGRTMAGG